MVTSNMIRCIVIYLRIYSTIMAVSAKNHEGNTIQYDSFSMQYTSKIIKYAELRDAYMLRERMLSKNIQAYKYITNIVSYFYFS